LRPIAGGSVYHVINRGNGRQNVFLHEGDYLAFFKAAAELNKPKPFGRFGQASAPGALNWRRNCTSTSPSAPAAARKTWGTRPPMGNE
jgi:hypothetical protein